MRPVTLFSMILWIALMPLKNAAGIPAPQVQPPGMAMISRLEGDATRKDENTPVPLSLKKNDYLQTGNHIQTGVNSRMALAFPGSRRVRMNELTTVHWMPPNDKSKPSDIILDLKKGYLWVNLPERKSSKERLTIMTGRGRIQTARGVFRVSVFPDNTTQIKVYRGSVEVRNKKTTARKDSAFASRSNRKSNSWSYVLKPMQQFVIRPDGSSTQPFPFMVKPDRSTWVLWNQSLDKVPGNESVPKK